MHWQRTSDAGGTPQAAVDQPSGYTTTSPNANSADVATGAATRPAAAPASAEVATAGQTLAVNRMGRFSPPRRRSRTAGAGGPRRRKASQRQL